MYVAMFNSTAGVFFWAFLNVHPAYRSTLHSIQLLAVVKSSYLKKYGVDAILKPAVQDLKKLTKDVKFHPVLRGQWAFIRMCMHLQGILVDYCGASRKLFGCLVAFLGDTPAAALVGGFKEGVGGAVRGCRTCMTKNAHFSSKVSFAVQYFVTRIVVCVTA